MTSYKTVQSATYLALPSLLIVGIIYFAVTFLLSRAMKTLELRLKAGSC